MPIPLLTHPAVLPSAHGHRKLALPRQQRGPARCEPQGPACIGWFSKSGSQESLFNTYDVGLYVQQSYYGDEDSSAWNGKPWRHNPVLAGSWKNEPAEVVEMKPDATSIYTKTKPRHRARGEFTP